MYINEFFTYICNIDVYICPILNNKCILFNPELKPLCYIPYKTLLLLIKSTWKTVFRSPCKLNT